MSAHCCLLALPDASSEAAAPCGVRSAADMAVLLCVEAPAPLRKEENTRLVVRGGRYDLTQPRAGMSFFTTTCRHVRAAL